MDDWFYGEDHSCSCLSSGSFSESYDPELEFDYLELVNSEPKNLATVQINQQFYEETNIPMDARHLTATIQQSQLGFTIDPSRPSSSSSSLQSFSGGSPDCFPPLSNLMPDSQAEIIKAIPLAQSQALPHQVTIMASNEQCNIKFPNIRSDDMAITRAILAVISSGSSSSSTSLLEEQSQQQEQANQGTSNGPSCAFKPYNSFPAPKFVPKAPNSQKMIKKAITMMSKIAQIKVESPVAESRSATHQLYHMISERRRREKLNGNFQALRLLLPPGSKKDKASVLVNTKNYMNTLKAQICELEEKNRELEMHLPPTARNKEVRDSSRVEVQIVKAPKSTSGLQEINTKITVTVECDITELVLQVLDCLKEMRVISLTSVDAKTCTPLMNFNARTILTLQFKAKDWDEVWFKEMITMAVDSMS